MDNEIIEIKLNCIVISPLYNRHFDYAIECLIDTPKGIFKHRVAVTKEFLKDVGIDFIYEISVKKYKDVTKENEWI